MISWLLSTKIRSPNLSLRLLFPQLRVHWYMYGLLPGSLKILVKTSQFGPEKEIYSHSDSQRDIWWGREFVLGQTTNFQVNFSDFQKCTYKHIHKQGVNWSKTFTRQSDRQIKMFTSQNLPSDFLHPKSTDVYQSKFTVRFSSPKKYIFVI